MHALLKVLETMLYVHCHSTDRVVMTMVHVGGKFGGGCAVLVGLHGPCQE